MLTDPNDFHPVMGNWPRNREDLNRHAWAMYAPALLALMPAGDPGPVPEDIRADYQVDEDEVQYFDPHTITEADIAEALGRVSPQDSLGAYLADGPAARAKASRGGHVHAEPTKAVRRHLTVVR